MYTVRVHDRLHGRTVRLHGRVHGRVHSSSTGRVYGRVRAVYTARKKGRVAVYTSRVLYRVHGLNTARVHAWPVYGPCTRPVHGPCTWSI